MNNQRRVFRGRGGPTDGRLPKHNARRANRPKATKPASNKYEADPDDMEVVVMVDSSPTDGVDADNKVDSESAEAQDVEASKPTEKEPSQAVSACQQEVLHLQKRVQNVRETLQLSNTIANPAIYQETVLNAVANCVNEWRSIVRHYNVEEEDPYLEEAKKPTTLAVYELMQHSLQCGPLAGAKPGYFKRCGGAVAKVVVKFLEQVVPNPQLGELMGFSTKQLDAMEQWKTNAQKAADNDKPPSKSALKHQQGKGTGKKAKKKKKG